MSQSHAQQVKELREKNQNERIKEINEKKLSYQKIKDEPAFLDILQKATEFANYHTKMAKDGVGWRKTGGTSSGDTTEEVVYYTAEKRLSEIDKAAGIEELKTYIERQVSEEGLRQVKPKRILVDQEAS